ncbi:ferritin-like domain-containing protein [Halobaculum litoreum]|uniref:ferritin-like domain-containing protein n=1 Tax=Halobaculum litoreum TaxID=3031998 RepID=UPI0024C3176B|nr:ferritin-like domain-containing protein [Halobaculum sp. DT92]
MTGREQISSRIKAASGGSSRRGFLARTAVAGGGLALFGGGTGLTLAQEDDDEGEGTGADEAGADVDVLNYALALEHLEDAFYVEVLDTFDEADFVDAEALQSFDEETRQDAYGFVETVGEHESAHVEVLTGAVEELGGDPAQPASYDFGVESVGDALALGQVLENTGVAAYAGAAPSIENPDLLAAALSIHSVEARHAAYLNELNGDSPFPDAFDPASSQEEVLEAISGFIVEDDGEEESDDGDESESDGGTEEGGTGTPAGDGASDGGTEEP